MAQYKDLPDPPYYGITQTRLDQLHTDQNAYVDSGFMSAETARAIFGWHHDGDATPASPRAFHHGFIRGLEDRKSTRSRLINLIKDAVRFDLILAEHH